MTSPDDIRRRLDRLERRDVRDLSESELSDRAKSLYMLSLQQTAEPDADGNAGEAYVRTIDELRRRREGDE